MNSTAISGYNAFPFTPGTKSLDNLKVHELQTEVRMKGVATQHKLKPALAKEFEGHIAKKSKCPGTSVRHPRHTSEITWSRQVRNSSHRTPT